ncbi:dihydrofolate reductase [Odoribacter sp. OttesenSCG-928-J03]|nr:dihydrofolate reductase [Odoribacter sp. OttesenSCG-928-J03]
MKLLISYNLPREAFTDLPAGWEATFPEGDFFTKEEIIRMIPEFDVILSSFSIQVDRDILDAGKNLKLVSNYGVGYNNIDIAYAREKGIAVSNTPASVCNPTAELCLALMLGVARRIPELDHRLRIEKESMWGTMKNLGTGLEGKTLGIIGMGRIGKNVAEKAQVFGMNIIYYNPRSEVSGYKRVDFDTLLKEADFISLHSPLNENTRHMISEREFGLMKKNTFLINTSRGAVVDEKALVTALKNKCIKGVALDVFEAEPHVTEELYQMDNVVMVPHIGTATIEGRIAMAQEALENIKNFVNGTSTNIVN